MRFTWKVSSRSARSVLRTQTSTYRYESRRGDQVGLSHRIHEITQTRMRYGYRRIQVLLRREG